MINKIIGEFHFQMHFCLSLYCLGGTDYLIPIGKEAGFQYLAVDFPLAKWDYHNEFLLLFCDASMKWLQGNLFYY